MAAARAVPEFTDTVESVGVFIFLVRTWFEIIGMTRCAIRHIGGCRPRYYLAVGLMAGGAEKIASVISRIRR